MNPHRAVLDGSRRMYMNRLCRMAVLLAALLLGSDSFAPRLRAQDKPAVTPPAGKPTAERPRILALHAAGEEREGAAFLQRRQRWFFHPRTYPLGFIPAGARERALAHVRRMQQQQQLAQGGTIQGAQLQAVQPQSAPGSGSAQLAAPGSGTGPGFAPPPSGTGAAWAAIGPQATISTFNLPYTSGRVTALAVDPCDATGNTFFLGGADGGVWKLTNGSGILTPLFDYQPLISVGAIAIDPTSHTCAASVVYVGTGEDNFGGDNIYGAGVFKSTNGGATWTRDNTFSAFGLPSNPPLDDTRAGPMIGAIAVNRKAGANNILLAAVRGRGAALQSGVWCSADSGVNWTHVLPVIAPTATGDPGTDVAFGSDGTAWAALGFPFGDSNNGIYKSSAPVTSCTITWTLQNLPAGVAASKIGRIALAIAPSNNNTLYAAIADSSTSSSKLLGVVKTTNASNATPSWTQLTASLVNAANGFCNDQCFYDLVLAVHPADANTVFAGGAANNATVIRSLDGGSTWTEISRNNVSGALDALHVDTHAFAFNTTGSVLYVGNDGGVWSTNDPKGTVSGGYWNNLNGSLNITQFYPGLSIHPSTPNFALGGTQDNGVQLYNPGNTGSLVWTDTGLGCDGGFTAIDPQIPSTTYGECEYIPNPGGILVIAVSYAGDGILGKGYLATTGIDPTDRGSFIPPLVLDKNNPQTIYFGTCRVWQTTDGANTWNAISPDVTTSAHTAGCSGTTGGNLTAIAAAPSASTTIYTGADNGEIEATTNSGSTWTSLTTSALPGRSITQVAVDPANSKKAYVAFSGFGTCSNVAIICDGKGHVFMSADATNLAANPWTDISGTGAGALPDIPVNDIVIDPDDPTHNTLYIATDVGAFFTTDGGTSWSVLGAPNTLPNSEILSLVLHNPSRTLRAATHGRGVWDLNLGPAAGTPALRIGSIAPFKANAGDGLFTLTVTGSGLTGGTVRWNGSTTNVTQGGGSDTQLTATIAAALVAASGTPKITVTAGANTSNALTFTVLGNPPTLTSIVPAQVTVGSAAATITLTGTNFTSGSQVAFNGSTANVTVTDTTGVPTTLKAQLAAALLGPYGSTDDITVVNPPPGGGASNAKTFAVVAPAPPNDNFANAINITVNSYTDTKDSSGATTEAADPLPACVYQFTSGQGGNNGPYANGLYNTIWYKFTAPSSGGTLNLDTIGSSYDSVLSVWTGSSQASLTAVSGGCNDDITPGIVLESQLSGVALTGGTTYYIMVSSFGPPDPNPIALGGKSVLNFQFGQPPFSLTPQAPTSVTVSAGNSASYTIAVAPANAFTGTVMLSCSSPAPATSCSVNPTSVTLGSSTNVTVTVATTRRGALPPPRFPGRYSPLGRRAPLGLLAILVLFFAVSVARRPRHALAFSLPLAGLLLLLAAMAAGCGGGSGGGGGGGATGTTAGTYTITVTGTSGASTSRATVTLVVN